MSDAISGWKEEDSDGGDGDDDDGDNDGFSRENLDDVSVQLQYSCGCSWQTCGLLDEGIHCGNSA